MSDDFSKQPETDERTEHHADEDRLHESNDGELLGVLLDEVSEPDEGTEIEPAITPTDADAIAIEEKVYNTSDEAPEEEKKSNLLLIGIIVAALVGSIAYFTTKSDSPEKKQAVTASNKAASPVTTAQKKTVPHDAKKAAGPAVTSANQAEIAEKPVVLKPLLDHSTSTSDETTLSSTVAAILEIDPVTRKVISPLQGTTFAWAINLMSLSTHAAADRLINKLKASGTATELVQVNIGENTFYRVRIPDFSSVEEADAAHAKFKENPIYQGSWVSRYHK